jgi:hypothetical protein
MRPLSQGEYFEVIKTEIFREEMKETIYINFGLISSIIGSKKNKFFAKRKYA